MAKAFGWRWILGVAVLLASAVGVAADDTKGSRLDELKALIVAGKFADAESGARGLLTEVEAASGAEPAEAVAVLDLLVESLYRGTKAREAETRQLAERAVAIKERVFGPEDPGLSQSLQNLANVLNKNQDPAGARKLYDRALAIREQALGPDHVDVARTLVSFAKFLDTTGDYATSLPMKERVVAIKEKALGPDSLELAANVIDLANALYLAGEFARARPLYERAAAIREKNLGPNHPDVGQALMGLAADLSALGEFGAARETLDRVLKIFEQAYGPDHPLVARALNNLAIVYRQTGDYAQARPVLERALTILDHAVGPDSPDVASNCINLGNLLWNMGDYTAARQFDERALAIREKAFGPDHPAVAQALNNLAVVLKDLGDRATARQMYERALAIREKALGPDHPEVAVSVTNLGELAMLEGDYASARRSFERALAILEKAYGPDHPEVANGLDNLGAVLENTGDLAGARQLQARALAISEKALGPDHPEVAKRLDNLAAVARKTGDPAGADAMYERSLAIRVKALGPGHPLVAKSDYDLAGLDVGRGRLADALDHALAAEQIARDHMRRTGRSLSEREALGYAAARTSGLDLALTLAGRGLDGASRRRALDALVRSRAVVLDEMASRHRAVSGANNAEVASLAIALASARASYANLAVRGLGDQKPEIYRKLLDSTREETERCERALASASAGFAREQSRNQLGLDQVAASLPPGSALVAFAQYTRLDTTPDSPAAARAPAVTSYLAFVLRQGEQDPQLMDLGPAEAIDAAVSRWKKEASGGSDERAYRDMSAALRKKVWDPLATAMGDASRVFVVPDGSLHLVSLAALPADAGGYLIESGPVVHYVSAERDLVTSGTTRRGDGLLALGGPNYDATSMFAALQKDATMPGGPARPKDEPPVLIAAAGTYRGAHPTCGDFASARFGPLPATGKETRDIARLWDKYAADGPALAGRALELRDAAASETALKRSAPGRRVLHLATHGYFLEGECESAQSSRRGIGGVTTASSASQGVTPPPASAENQLLLSGLVLAGANHRAAAGANEDDGILTAEEIASLDLSGVEWAVLSACETGVGDVRAGEGVFGLRRAFQVAGAGTLIMSLWAVDDEATRTWMKSLYEARLGKKLDTADSVRQASLTVLNIRRRAGQSTHPFYWAAFVAAGDWK